MNHSRENSPKVSQTYNRTRIRKKAAIEIQKGASLRSFSSSHESPTATRTWITSLSNRIQLLIRNKFNPHYCYSETLHQVPKKRAVRCYTSSPYRAKEVILLYCYYAAYVGDPQTHGSRFPLPSRRPRPPGELASERKGRWHQ
ncbi:hypothetical protein E2C01_016978 [Portunus trituberculatus]|uniref:Uncharacterized protein n=1 Tax=Portunus trituberculatus TaxID=210409 RepID=A0A5B7DQG7_PORTR|nr:hypothetical protein [Portunus trituberculatus]